MQSLAKALLVPALLFVTPQAAYSADPIASGHETRAISNDGPNNLENLRHEQDVAEFKLEISDLKSQMQDRWLYQLQTEIAIFGILLTVMIIFFSLRVTSEAKSEARNEARAVARAEIKEVREDLKKSSTELKVLISEAREAAEDTSILGNEIRDKYIKTEEKGNTNSSAD